MKFKIVEGAYLDIEQIYDDFEKEYLYSLVSNPELKKKFGLNKREWVEITRKVKERNNISRRPYRRREGKHYYSQGKGYAIRKFINGKLHHLGTVPTEEIAIKIVALCEKEEWDINKCHKILDRWYEYI